MSQDVEQMEICCICADSAKIGDLVSSQSFEHLFPICFKLKKIRQGLLCPSCLSSIQKWKKTPKERRRSLSSLIDSKKTSTRKGSVSDNAKKSLHSAVDTPKHVERKRHRSLIGCCICGAKSSATEFLPSDKLERFLKDCFKLEQKREGEICHACREIVKKWRREPRGAKEDYSQVVDSKIVPKKKHSSSHSNDEDIESTLTSVPKDKDQGQQMGQIFTYDNPIDTLSEEEDDTEDDDSKDVTMETPSPSVASSVTSASDYGDPFDSPEKKFVSTASQTAFLFPMLTSPQGVNSRLPFIDLSTWRQESICCGSIFRGPNGEVLVDPKWLKPYCDLCNRSVQPPTPIEKNNPTEISVFDEKLTSLCTSTT